jgi:hypothetical protein
MKKSLFILIMVLVFLWSAIPASAFDGRRQGFILGGGLGFNLTTYTQTLEVFGDAETSDRENKGAFSTNFKIGFAPDEQTEVYYISKVSWFGFENAFGDDVTMAFGLGGIGISHSLEPAVPTFFVTGGLGYSTWALPFEDNAPDTWYGFGIYGGGGYEFSRHYNVEFIISYGNPNDSEGGIEARTNGLTVALTVNALAY